MASKIPQFRVSDMDCKRFTMSFGIHNSDILKYPISREKILLYLIIINIFFAKKNFTLFSSDI